MLENIYGDEIMKKILYLFSFFMFIFYIVNIKNSYSIKAINVHNISSSDKYLAVESDENINGNVSHYIFLYDVVKNEKISINANNGDKINEQTNKGTTAIAEMPTNLEKFICFLTIKLAI